MKEPLRHEPVALGIVGLGMAGAVMVQAAAAHEDIRLVAAADPQPAPREAFVRDFGGTAYEDVRALCESDAVEAVYIATPHQFHRAHAIMAARCGKHVIVEKPLALTLEDCDAIVEAVERAGVTLIVGHTHGFDPAVRRMREIAGKLEELSRDGELEGAADLLERLEKGFAQFARETERYPGERAC